MWMGTICVVSVLEMLEMDFVGMLHSVQEFVVAYCWALVIYLAIYPYSLPAPPS